MNMTRTRFRQQLSDVSADVGSFASDLRGWVRSGLSRVTGSGRRALAERFAIWIEQRADPSLDRDGVEQLRLWVQNLDQQGREALTQQVAEFCEAFEIDLAWIVDEELKEWTQLNAMLSTTVIRYCLACKAAVDADDQLRQFRHRRVWRRKLKSTAKNGAFAASRSAS
ncbi:MAG: hypothetical protein GVY22_02880 [Gammaproteobacteria bacterium]|nr:hypothetical protein [Gammaproteobacteria bacterium]